MSSFTDREDPRVFGCPKSFTVHLTEGEVNSQVSWKEPVFKDNVEIAHLWKSLVSEKCFIKKCVYRCMYCMYRYVCGSGVIWEGKC